MDGHFSTITGAKTAKVCATTSRRCSGCGTSARGFAGEPGTSNASAGTFQRVANAGVVHNKLRIGRVTLQLPPEAVDDLPQEVVVSCRGRAPYSGQ